MTDREWAFARAGELRREIEALDIQDRCEEFAAAERILAKALLDAKARGELEGRWKQWEDAQ